MKPRRYLTVSIIIAATCSLLSPAQAKEVLILMRDGREVRVELLSVRDSALVICPLIDVSADVLQGNPRVATVVPLGSIDRVKVEGKSYVVTGLLLGALGGGIAGGLIGSAVTTEPEQKHDVVGTILITPVERAGNTLTGVLVGGLGGLLVGGLIGGGASTPESVLDPRVRGDREALRELSRFPRQEPAFLKGATAE